VVVLFVTSGSCLASTRKRNAGDVPSLVGGPGNSTAFADVFSCHPRDRKHVGRSDTPGAISYRGPGLSRFGPEHSVRLLVMTTSGVFIPRGVGCTELNADRLRAEFSTANVRIQPDHSVFGRHVVAGMADTSSRPATELVQDDRNRLGPPATRWRNGPPSPTSPHPR